MSVEQQLKENLAPFVDALLALQLDIDNVAECTAKVRPLVEKWVADTSWLPTEARVAKTLEDDYEVYVGDQGELMVLVVVWPTNNECTIHDHLTWGVVGTAQGVEENYLWRRLDDGSQVGYAEIERASSIRSEQGHTFTMDDQVIHSVVSCDPNGKDAVSLHVYGRDLTTTGRHKYIPAQNRVEPMPGLDS